MEKIIGIIPARYGSTRFPAKALADLGGKPMVQWVYEQCQKAAALHQVVVATDHERIAEAVARFGGRAVMTSPDHPSGTDRCAEALRLLPDAGQYAFAINIQGDEPFVHPEQIDLLAGLLRQGPAPIATLMHRMKHEADLHNPNLVKVVASQSGHALYFSRQAVPFLRDVPAGNWLQARPFYRHLGMYGFRADTLQELTGLAESPLEQAERLEQLRWLEAGYRIAVAETPHDSLGIDTPDDLQRALKHLNIFPHS